MNLPQRFTQKMKQEEISRHQLCERLINFGWLPATPKDLGEDFIVHIYNEGRASGVTFHLQEKSIVNLVARRKKNYLSYKNVEVKDVVHWHSFHIQTVVFVVWDIRLREGRWIFVDDIVSDLDQRKPNWRTGKTVTIRIPWSNTTDDVGLVRLRQEIGGRLFPVISKGKDLHFLINLNLSDTDEGRDARGELDKLIRKGERATFVGRAINSVNVSEWAKPWIGWYDPEKVALILEPTLPPDVLNVEIAAIGDNDETIFMPNIELKYTKFGSEIKQLSNEHQTTHLHFSFAFYPVEKIISFSTHINNLGGNASVARDIMRFHAALAVGGILRLTILSPEQTVADFPLPPLPNAVQYLDGIELIDKICRIQDKTHQFIRVPQDGWMQKEIKAIKDLSEVIERGVLRLPGDNYTSQLNREELKMMLEACKNGSETTFILRSEGSEFDIFDVQINTGPVVRYIPVVIKMSVGDLENHINSMNQDDIFDLEFIASEVVDVFPEWFSREADLLARKLVRQFGADKVYLYGSLAWEGSPNEHTSIELAVQGLASDRLSDASKVLTSSSKFAINIYNIDDVSDGLKNSIIENGKLLLTRNG